MEFSERLDLFGDEVFAALNARRHEASSGPADEGYVRMALVLLPDDLRQVVAAIGAVGI